MDVRFLIVHDHICSCCLFTGCRRNRMFAVHKCLGIQRDTYCFCICCRNRKGRIQMCFHSRAVTDGVDCIQLCAGICFFIFRLDFHRKICFAVYKLHLKPRHTEILMVLTQNTVIDFFKRCAAASCPDCDRHVIAVGIWIVSKIFVVHPNSLGGSCLTPAVKDRNDLSAVIAIRRCHRIFEIGVYSACLYHEISPIFKYFFCFLRISIYRNGGICIICPIICSDRCASRDHASVIYIQPYFTVCIIETVDLNGRFLCFIVTIQGIRSHLVGNGIMSKQDICRNLHQIMADSPLFLFFYNSPFCVIIQLVQNFCSDQIRSFL